MRSKSALGEWQFAGFPASGKRGESALDRWRRCGHVAGKEQCQW
jgi:hypothetical protein